MHRLASSRCTAVDLGVAAVEVRFALQQPRRRAPVVGHEGDFAATYDDLLAIALQPPSATKAVHNYEVIGKVASNTMAATVISAVLVGGYVLFGMFSKPPGATEIAPDGIDREAQVVAALHPDSTASNEPRVLREGDASTIDVAVTSAVAPAAKEANAAAIGRSNLSGFVSFNLAIQYYPRFATANFDRGIVLYRVGDYDRPFATLASPKPTTDLRRAKIATPVPRKPLAILPPTPPAPPERRMPITAALTP